MVGGRTSVFPVLQTSPGESLTHKQTPGEPGSLEFSKANSTHVSTVGVCVGGGLAVPAGVQAAPGTAEQARMRLCSVSAGPGGGGVGGGVEEGTRRVSGGRLQVQTLLLPPPSLRIIRVQGREPEARVRGMGAMTTRPPLSPCRNSARSLNLGVQVL